MVIRKYIPILVLTLMFCSSALAQQNEDKDLEENLCKQSETVKLQIIKTAESQSYRIRNVKLFGNIFLRDRHFRDKLVLEEGDIFTKKGFDENIRNVGKIKVLKPLTIKNVGIQLFNQDKDVNIIFCVEERKQKQ